jgi:hypothetical protein
LIGKDGVSVPADQRADRPGVGRSGKADGDPPLRF